MAELALGIGSSHSPMVTMNGADWLEWGQNDLRHPMLFDRSGRHLSYDEQLELAGDSNAERIKPDVCSAGAERVQAAVAKLNAVIGNARLDAIVVIGDDQDEHLLADNLPPFLIYWGKTIANAGIDNFEALPPLQQHFVPGYREPTGERHYSVAQDLAKHLIDSAFANDFDVSASSELPRPERGMGHAFGFTLRRLIEPAVPIVPVMINTYNPPSQPRAARCAAFGSMLRDAIGRYDADARIGVIASGGLSHFIVLEDFDREVIAALEKNNLDDLTNVPESTYVSGTSEIKNWITAASVCHDLAFELIDYVPGYRTPAGTGTGLAFATWT